MNLFAVSKLMIKKLEDDNSTFDLHFKKAYGGH